MKRLSFLPILFLLLFTNCSTGEHALQNDLEHSPQFQLSLLKEINVRIVRQYLLYADDHNITIPIGYYGWPEIERVWNEVPEIGRYRSEFEIADQNFIEFISEKDERMKEAREKWKNRTLESGEWSRVKAVTYRDVQAKYPKEYDHYFNERQEKLALCDNKTIEYLLNESISNDQLMAIDWIPGNHMRNILTEDFIQSLREDLDGFSVEMVEYPSN